MKEAVEHEQDFKYCILLSGADYPIKPTDHIQTFFKNATLEYIHYARLQNNPLAMMKKSSNTISTIRCHTIDPASNRGFSGCFAGRHSGY